MSDHRYILQPYKGPSSRHVCPGCGHRGKFSRYIDKSTGNQLADDVGRCDREDNCGYHKTPKDHFGMPSFIERMAFKKNQENVSIGKPMDFLPFDLMDRSVSNHRRCDLFPFLNRLFREDIADLLCSNYFVGPNKQGYTAFWQVDIAGRVRQCKIINYLPNGHRNKDSGVVFAGKKIANDQDANLQQCFFGEYLISLEENKDKHVGLVESEKTALIASVYFPGFVWIATGGKHGARWTERNVCKILAERSVVLFPDLGAYDTWKAKGMLMAATAGCKVVVSDLLEKYANDDDRQNGLDIADYLLRTDDGSGLALTDLMYPIMFDYIN